MKKYFVLSLLFLLLLLCINTSLLAQPAAPTLYGVVTGNDNHPIVGAAITAIKSNSHTVSDATGRFSIKVAFPDTLKITATGYVTKYITVDSGSASTASLSIQLESERIIVDTVTVSTGYQRLPKERATGSFAFVGGGMLNQQTGSNILNRLDGVAPGVFFPKQPLQGGPSNGFMVRGLSTINGPKAPLVVVDNFPYEGDINNINPNDVESITVLKDAAATSIWGVRAGNGVIVINTKSGKQNTPLQVEVNANIVVTSKPLLSGLRVISSTDYIGVEQQLFDKGFYDRYLNDTRNYPALSPVVEVLNRAKNGTPLPGDATMLQTYRNTDLRDQFKNYVYQNEVAQ